MLDVMTGIEDVVDDVEHSTSVLESLVDSEFRPGDSTGSGSASARQRLQAQRVWLARLPQTVDAAIQVETLRIGTKVPVDAAIATAESMDGSSVELRGVRVEQSPWPLLSLQHRPLPLWDYTVGTAHQELAADRHALSPFTPVYRSCVHRETSSMHGENIMRLTQQHPLGGWLSSCARFGFDLICTLPPCNAVVTNPEFTAEEAAQISQWVKKEVAQHRMSPISAGTPTTPSQAGTTQPPFLVVSPFAAAAKAGSEVVGEIRVCHNYSAPCMADGTSVNSATSYESLNPIALLSHDTIIQRARYVRCANPTEEVFAAKLDFSKFFRQFALRQRCKWLSGQRWESVTYIHDVISFGSKSACHIASALTGVLSDLMAEAGHYVEFFVDDGVFVDTYERVEAAIVHLRWLISQFGLVENLDKFSGIVQKIVILGVAFDFRSCTAMIDEVKRIRMLTLVNGILTRPSQKITVLELQRLSGKFLFVAPIIPFSKAYTAPLWALLGFPSPSHSRRTPSRVIVGHKSHAVVRGHLHRHISWEVRRALEWWQRVLASPKGVNTTSFMIGVDRDLPLCIITGLSTDSSSTGYGGISVEHGTFIRGQWSSEEVAAHSINVRELATVWFLLTTVAHRLSGSFVVLHCDNLVSVYAHHTQMSQAAKLRDLVRLLCALQSQFRFCLVVQFVRTAQNKVADDLSRLPSQADSRSPECLPPLPSGAWTEAVISSPVQQRGLRAISDLHSVRSQVAEDRQSLLEPSTCETFAASDGFYVPNSECMSSPFPWISYLFYSMTTSRHSNPEPSRL